jgi:hypothetical protein
MEQQCHPASLPLSTHTDLLTLPQEQKLAEAQFASNLSRHASSSYSSIDTDGSRDKLAMDSSIASDLLHKQGIFTTFRELRRSEKLIQTASQ